MESKKVHHRVLLLCLCFFLMSGTKNAEKTPTIPIKGSQKLGYQENQEAFLFPSATDVQRDTMSGNIPVVNPTTPGTTPIVNPTSPIPPTTTGPYPTVPVPPTTTGPNPTIPPTTTGPNPTIPPTTTGPNPTIPPTTTGPNPTVPGPSGGSWCIANPSASQTALQVALDYACGYGGTDCSAIQPNGQCWDPNTLADHASYAFNDYYQKNPAPTSCVFGGAAQITNTDPSHGNCRFAAPTTTPTTPTTPPATPMAEPPPSPTMPTNPGTPGGDTGTDGDYGAEPTGEPSSAQTASSNLALLIITICCLVMPLAMV